MTSTLTTRFAALGAAAALGTTALVAAAPAAEAKVFSGASSYTCETSVGNYDFQVKTKVKLPGKVKKGQELGARKVKLTAVLPAELVGALNFVGVTSLSGEASGAKGKIGKTKLKLDRVTFKETDVPASGTMALKGKGKTKPVVLKKAGKHDVQVPKKFKFTAYNQDGQPLVEDAPCTFASGEKTIGSLKVK